MDGMERKRKFGLIAREGVNSEIARDVRPLFWLISTFVHYTIDIKHIVLHTILFITRIRFHSVP